MNTFKPTMTLSHHSHNRTMALPKKAVTIRLGFTPGFKSVHQAGHGVATKEPQLFATWRFCDSASPMQRVLLAKASISAALASARLRFVVPTSNGEEVFDQDSYAKLVSMCPDAEVAGEHMGQAGRTGSHSDPFDVVVDVEDSPNEQSSAAREEAGRVAAAKTATRAAAAAKAAVPAGPSLGAKRAAPNPERPAPRASRQKGAEEAKGADADYVLGK